MAFYVKIWNFKAHYALTIIMENMVLFLCHLFWIPFLVTLLLEQVSHFISLTCQVKREINTIMNCRGSDQSAIALETAIFFLTKKCWYFFLFLHQNICCGYSLEVPDWIFIWIQLASRSVSIYAAWLGCFLWPVVSTVAIMSVYKSNSAVSDEVDLNLLSILY